MGSGVLTGHAWRVVAAAFLIAGCAAEGGDRVVRGADDVQVMTPEEVAAARAAIDNVVPATTAAPEVTTAVPSTAVEETVPVNKDDRPPELRLFDAFGKFRSCLEDKGYVIEGNLQDPNNPAYQDAGYRDAVSTCAARTDIVNILAEVQATRANLTPEQVKERNEVFVELSDCLEDKGWTVETRTSEIGLLEPVVFEGPDGTLDERDIDACVSQMNIGEG